MPAGGFQETKAVSSSISVAFTSRGGPAGAVGTGRLSMKPLELQRVDFQPMSSRQQSPPHLLGGWCGKPLDSMG